MYWGIDQALSYGSDTTLLAGSAGIVDTGTTLLMIATDAFDKYQRATGAKMDQATGLLTVTDSQFESMQSLFFNIGTTAFRDLTHCTLTISSLPGGVTYEMTPNAQIWPRSLNSMLGGDEGKIYLVIADLGNNSGQGLDFISEFLRSHWDKRVLMFLLDGFVFLQRFYSVYDTGNKSVGLATTPFTDAETN